MTPVEVLDLTVVEARDSRHEVWVFPKRRVVQCRNGGGHLPRSAIDEDIARGGKELVPEVEQDGGAGVLPAPGPGRGLAPPQQRFRPWPKAREAAEKHALT